MLKKLELALFFCLLFSTSFIAFAKSAPTSKQCLTIFAASSLTNILPAIAKEWKLETGLDVNFSFEATSRLARQIEAGAPADIFISADLEWMDHLEKVGKIESGSRTSLASNQIALVVPSDSDFVPLSSSQLLDSRIKHLALAGEAVPAGKFARAALKSQGVLEKLQEKIVNADNVRAALLWVAKKQADAGIVFETDARIEPKVKIAFKFPKSSHPKIEYPAGILQGTKHFAEAKQFLDFCKSSTAKRLFESAGFTALSKP